MTRHHVDGSGAPATTVRDPLAYETELPGRGRLVQLGTPGPSEQKYSLSFQADDGLPPSDPVTMSWGTVEQIKDKAAPTPSIDAILDMVLLDLHRSDPKEWPYDGQGNKGLDQPSHQQDHHQVESLSHFFLLSTHTHLYYIFGWFPAT